MQWCRLNGISVRQHYKTTKSDTATSQYPLWCGIRCCKEAKPHSFITAHTLWLFSLFTTTHNEAVVTGLKTRLWAAMLPALLSTAMEGHTSVWPGVVWTMATRYRALLQNTSTQITHKHHRPISARHYFWLLWIGATVFGPTVIVQSYVINHWQLVNTRFCLVCVLKQNKQTNKA